MLKKVIITVLSAVVLFLAIGAVVLYEKRDLVVMRVDDMEVTESEFLLVFQNEFRAECLAMAEPSDGENPWDTTYQGLSLRELAMEKTCDKILLYKAEQQLFREYGVCDWTYDTFRAAYEKQSSGKDGKNVYGKQKFSEYDYYIYLQSNYRLRTVQNLKEKQEDEDELYQYYLEHKEELRETEDKGGQIPEFSDCRSIISKRYYEELYTELTRQKQEEQKVEKTGAYRKIKLF